MNYFFQKHVTMLLSVAVACVSTLPTTPTYNVPRQRGENDFRTGKCAQERKDFAKRGLKHFVIANLQISQQVKIRANLDGESEAPVSLFKAIAGACEQIKHKDSIAVAACIRNSGPNPGNCRIGAVSACAGNVDCLVAQFIEKGNAPTQVAGSN